MGGSTNWKLVISVKSDKSEVTLRYSNYNELPIMSIDFLLAFTQAGLDMDVFMELPLGMGFYVNRVEWGIKLNKSLYGINKASGNWFNPLKNGLERSFYHRSQVEAFVFYGIESVV